MLQALAYLLIPIAAFCVAKKDANKCGSPPKGAICLKQKDFATGTVRIDKPGDYKLCEDIVFHPNGPQKGSLPAEDAFDPDLTVFDRNSYGMGFFTAVSIRSSDVNFYLNCHSIEQSAGHALFQRFFAVIELASSPFIFNAGPGNFTASDNGLKAASNVLIKGPGTIGRSAHHGIHGNNNINVVIENVKFENFEVAAVALNNVNTAKIKDCDIPNNRHDVPVLGSFSAARQLRPYGKILKKKNYSMNINGKITTAAELYDRLITSINKVYEDVIIKKKKTGGFIDPASSPEEHYLFDNPFRVVDGPCYVFLIHGKGPAVGEFGFALNPDDSLNSKNIRIVNNNAKNIKCWTNEVPAAVVSGKVQTDVRGAVLQFVSSVDNKPLAINTDGTYRRNLVADLQIMIANALVEGEITITADLQSVSTIDKDIIDWASSNSGVFRPKYRCNGDSMHHVSKGMVMMRMEDTIGFKIMDNKFKSIENLSVAPFGSSFGTCTDYQNGLNKEDRGYQQGGDIRVVSISAVAANPNGPVNEVQNNEILDVVSKNGNFTIGVDIQGRSKSINIDKNTVDIGESRDDYNRENTIDLRIREFVDCKGTVKVGIENKFSQKVLILNARCFEERTEKSLLEVHGNITNEWEVGGCPMARAMY